MGDAKGAVGGGRDLFRLVFSELFPAGRFEELGELCDRNGLKLGRGGIADQKLLGGRAEDIGEKGFILREYLVKGADDLALEVGDGIGKIAAKARERSEGLDGFVGQAGFEKVSVADKFGDEHGVDMSFLRTMAPRIDTTFAR